LKSLYFLNLTNGIEALDIFPEHSFIRIQSTACEQKRWGFLLNELDYNFLLNLALGNRCIVVDYSARKEIPRSIYQGVEWIKYALNVLWFNKEIIPLVKGNDCTIYFRQALKTLNNQTKKKIKYFRKFLHTQEIFLESFSGRTSKDGDYNYYRDLLRIEF